MTIKPIPPIISDINPLTDKALIILETTLLSFASIEFATDIPNPIKENAPKNTINPKICNIIKMPCNVSCSK